MAQESPQTALEDFLEGAIKQRLSHRLAALVAYDGHRFEFHAGDSKPETEYDLASLTKILCTTLLTALAVSEQKLDLDESPWPHWPHVTIRHVLTHQAGLPPYIDVKNQEDVLAIKPTLKPGEQTLYSDMGFIALGYLLEQRLGHKLDYFQHFAQTKQVHFYGPEPANDKRCRDLGGMTGHAGLFGTLEGVYEEACFFLKCLTNPESKLELTIKYFAEQPGHWALGFAHPTEGGTTGEALSPQSIGHLGYTGTSLWIVATEPLLLCQDRKSTR